MREQPTATATMRAAPSPPSAPPPQRFARRPPPLSAAAVHARAMTELQERRAQAARIRREHVRRPEDADPVDLMDALLAARAAEALLAMTKAKAKAKAARRSSR